MPLLNNEKRSLLAFLTSKALALSYKEQFFPQIFPFFKIGLSNAVILKSFDFSYSVFFALCVLKSFAACTISGTLFSPFFIVSFVQSVFSGSLMYAVNKLHLNSVFGLSALGAAFSAVVQILFCSFYMKQDLSVFLGPMLFFSLFSSVLSASVALKLKFDFSSIDDSGDSSCKKSVGSEQKSIQEKQMGKTKFCILIFCITGFSVAIFFVKNLIILTIFLAVCLCLQFFAKRKFRLLNHLFLWAFIILVPFLLNQNSAELLLDNVRRALRLSSSIALSQACTKIRFPKNSMIALTLKNFNEEV
ncbi:Gx transporter family protein [Treponema pectinovorum]|uniref:Gx transporter family protein n=1 Tax=Treponema pectinovorum TaxID=164 RepID=UPI0011F0AEA8|nr:Gx transporter family protein [Treponema pectinovorum]